jgi:NADPH:quinone reductase-like Zn-dependent oxidoreductase
MSHNLPAQHKALLLDGQQGNFVLGTIKVHQPGPGQLLLKVKATALNPVDWKIQKYGIFVNDFPAVLGTDLAGDVVALGEGVTKFSVGDRVYVHLSNNTDKYFLLYPQLLPREIHQRLCIVPRIHSG